MFNEQPFRAVRALFELMGILIILHEAAQWAWKNQEALIGLMELLWQCGVGLNKALLLLYHLANNSVTEGVTQHLLSTL